MTQREWVWILIALVGICLGVLLLVLSVIVSRTRRGSSLGRSPRVFRWIGSLFIILPLTSSVGYLYQQGTPRPTPPNTLTCVIAQPNPAGPSADVFDIAIAHGRNAFEVRNYSEARRSFEWVIQYAPPDNLSRAAAHNNLGCVSLFESAPSQPTVVPRPTSLPRTTTLLPTSQSSNETNRSSSCKLSQTIAQAQNDFTEASKELSIASLANDNLRTLDVVKGSLRGGPVPSRPKLAPQNLSTGSAPSSNFQDLADWVRQNVDDILNRNPESNLCQVTLTLVKEVYSKITISNPSKKGVRITVYDELPGLQQRETLTVLIEDTIVGTYEVVPGKEDITTFYVPPFGKLTIEVKNKLIQQINGVESTSDNGTGKLTIQVGPNDQDKNFFYCAPDDTHGPNGEVLNRKPTRLGVDEFCDTTVPPIIP